MYCSSCTSQFDPSSLIKDRVLEYDEVSQIVHLHLEYTLFIFKTLNSPYNSLHFWMSIRGIKKETSRRHLKRKEPESGMCKPVTIIACATNSGSDKSAEVHCPPLEGHGCKSRD